MFDGDGGSGHGGSPSAGQNQGYFSGAANALGFGI